MVEYNCTGLRVEDQVKKKYLFYFPVECLHFCHIQYLLDLLGFESRLLAR